MDIRNRDGAVGQNQGRHDIRKARNNRQADLSLFAFPGRQGAQNSRQPAQQNPFGDPVHQKGGQNQNPGDNRAVSPRIRSQRSLQLFQPFHHVFLPRDRLFVSYNITRKDDFERAARQ